MCAVRVVSRSAWGAESPRQQLEMEGPARCVILHHTAMPQSALPQNSVSQLARIQRLHLYERRFDDIGYNFLISGDGTVFEGRGWGVVGAHAREHNLHSVGIAFLGNFNEGVPSEAFLCALMKLLQSGAALHHLQPGFELLGHRDVAETECPGEFLYMILPELREHIQSKEFFNDG